MVSEITRDFTATTFVVQDRRTVLLFHKKVRQWLPPGGHIRPNELPCDAAVREVEEETGLKVELTSKRARMGTVEVLCRPEYILLEQITPSHQHIDLIYFARVVGGRFRYSVAEAEGYRWCTEAELDDSEILEDIRQLGKTAIQKVRSCCGDAEDGSRTDLP